METAQYTITTKGNTSTLVTDGAKATYTIKGDEAILGSIKETQPGRAEVAFEHFLRDIERRGISEFRSAPKSEAGQQLLRRMVERGYVTVTGDDVVRGVKGHSFEIAETAAGRTQLRGGMIMDIRQEVRQLIMDRDQLRINVAKAATPEELVNTLNEALPGGRIEIAIIDGRVSHRTCSIPQKQHGRSAV